MKRLVVLPLVATLLPACAHSGRDTPVPPASTPGPVERIGHPGPGERIGHGLVFDEAAAVVLLFGGVNPAGESLGDTWIWDGRRWALVSTSGPSPRKWPTMVFDPHRRRTVLFGGRVGAGDATRSASDTWEWNGSQWMERPDSGPPGRDHAAMTYDLSRRRILLHGGWSGTAFLGDTWERASGAWRQIATDGPSPRAAHSLTCDESRSEVVLFGGRSPGFTNDTWILREAGWVALTPASSPPARAFHAAAFDLRAGRVTLFGGRDGPTLYADAWSWDGTTWHSLDPGRQSEGAGPSPRAVFTLVDDRARAELLFHGGGSMPEDRWLLHDETWALRDTGWIRRWPPQ